jgi:hypothetical protein
MTTSSPHYTIVTNHLPAIINEAMKALNNAVFIDVTPITLTDVKSVKELTLDENLSAVIDLTGSVML